MGANSGTRLKLKLGPGFVLLTSEFVHGAPLRWAQDLQILDQGIPIEGEGSVY